MNGLLNGLLKFCWLVMVLLALFLYERLIFIPKLLKILQLVNKRPQFCVMRYVFWNFRLSDWRQWISVNSDLINSFLRGAILTERERNELNNRGIRILNTRAIGYSSQFTYRGGSYDKLRKVSKFKVNHLILGDHVVWLN